MDKKSVRVIAKKDNIRVIKCYSLEYNCDNKYYYKYHYYIVQVRTSYCFGLLYKWVDVQVWIVDELNDDRWCYNEAMELFNIITNKYGVF